MISIIICSRNPDISDKLKQNIAKTIGVEYELIVIDNSKNKYTIFSAYNEGVRRAQYPYLCFMHDDILYHTDNWGIKIIEHFKDEKIGLIGVIGGHYMPKCPASWWSTEYRSGQILQGNSSLIEYNAKFANHSRYNNRINSISVAAVDGLWFCIPNELFKNISFDEHTYTGFHCYDADICLQVINQAKEVVVVYDILIEHFSAGFESYDFLEERIKWFNKWEKYLPIIKGIEISEFDIEDRLCLAEKINNISLLRARELKQIQSSKAYRLGKFLLKPFSYLRHKLVF